MQKNQTAPILLAEDHPVNQKVALILLERFGFTADAVGSGREAVDAYQAKKYDLILMDVMMPDMDGFEATRLIREIERGTDRHIPIIALTAMAMVGDRERCIQAGMDDYITKPIDPELLRAKLTSWISGQGQRSYAPSEGDDGSIGWEQLQHNYSDEQIDEILRMFLNISASLCQDVELAVQREDWSTVERISHELKGSSSAVYAVSLQQLCLDLEQSARGDHARARELVPQIRKSFASLERLINNRPTTAANK
jgi:CheY-like chemotaxis protein/HPt (histidine-containing phosphotransfer) domain-containing protein